MIIADTVTDQMRFETAAKFAKWDNLKNSNSIDKFKYLSDPTIYFYAFVRDEADQPVRLYPYQDAILNDPHRKIIFAASNQIGKSYSLAVKAFHYAILNPGKTVLMISETMSQCKDLLRKIKDFIRMSTLSSEFAIGDTETKTEIYFKHVDLDGNELKQSRIVCVPATTAALGYAADLLLIDELAFFENSNYFYYQIAQPRTYATKGQIIVFSNPNGKLGVFWDLWNDSEFHQYRFYFLDKPENTRAEYEKLRIKLTREQFDSTVDAKFTDAEGSFLSFEERKSIQVARPNYVPVVITSPLYVFFDFAKIKDNTVRFIASKYQYDRGEGVYVHEMKEYPNNTPYDVVMRDFDLLTEQVGAQNVFMVGWDNTGVGGGISDFIKYVENKGIMTQPVIYSLENKSRMYVMFKLLVETGRITMPFIGECDKQLSQMVFTKTSRGYLQVHHAEESDKDDYVDACVGVCSLIINPENPPVSATIINELEDDDDDRENIGFVEQKESNDIVHRMAARMQRRML